MQTASCLFSFSFTSPEIRLGDFEQRMITKTKSDCWKSQQLFWQKNQFLHAIVHTRLLFTYTVSPHAWLSGKSVLSKCELNGKSTEKRKFSLFSHQRVRSAFRHLYTCQRQPRILCPAEGRHAWQSLTKRWPVSGWKYQYLLSVTKASAWSNSH